MAGEQATRQVAEDWHQQRHRHAVADRSGAGAGYLLSDAKFGGPEGSGLGDCGGWEGGGGVGCWRQLCIVMNRNKSTYKSGEIVDQIDNNLPDLPRHSR